MTISRREIVKAGMAAGTALSFPSVLQAQTAPSAARAVHMAMGDLRAFDPVYTNTFITGNHALTIYDQLFALDSKLMSRPQMVGKWSASDDKKIYTFELRDGLGFHDGSPVTAADCVASIRRWAQVDPGGQLIMERAKDIAKKDDKTFSIVLKEPLGLMTDLLAYSGYTLFVMREKDADRPATEQVTANIGSGPFRFNEALAKPGASFTYDRNDKYVPRNESPDGFAGGKIVKVDRIVWNNIADEQTAFAALQAGEVDFLSSPHIDLLAQIRSDPKLALEVLNKGGLDYYLRLNFLQPPFDNVKARQAMLHLIDQEAFLSVMCPDKSYRRTLTSIFGNDGLYSNEENTGWYKKGGDPEKARQLFREAGYTGEKIVILDPTSNAITNDASQLLAATLQKIGVNAELAPSDWGGVVARRANKGPVDRGGWNIFISADTNFALSNPLIDTSLLANGDKAWYGWPKSDEYEALRAKWPDVATLQDRQALARRMQSVWWDFVGGVFLGQIFAPIAHRKTLTGFIGMPAYVPMWNIQKA